MTRGGGVNRGVTVFRTWLEEMFISSDMRGDISLLNVYCGVEMIEVCTQGALGVPCEGRQWQNCWKESHEKEDDQSVLLSANRMRGETSSLLLERAHWNQR